ncbi:MAG: bifunctional DNA-formamidopyrimidine glycosylase/DNA-(apurinic or apyrimidinic site) lyase [Betaproteobacteria bacterium]|nr:bifunctional DNA-formamidopyrimidine glycosylase/DNA-(apurinic or apyrimidinic site) lyase [Betaproteobacteria bacterium]MBU6511045.1 bifunctional DNA-formamidopyrimidine glycosylase/DNA-(apurinic or apyrimidinic site) lyase [Betaproteobacteria bacterium]MDE2150717.1 bifunctional DNA-formamidopyrimidine glycosylase/DNA-(apurinic or apyrimidinic site) lyase [Betaproteobacteria bacterium]
MPELPEVEVTRRALLQPLRGSVVRGAALGKPLRWPLQCEPDSLAGQRIERLERRGKYLLLGLQRGQLIVHLGMSGSLRWLDNASAAAPQPGPHEHFRLLTDRGELRMNDPRRFGAVIWQALPGPAHPLLSHLGPEPLEPGFDGEVLWRAVHPRRAAIKLLLLDQSVVAGVGNIYACEALFRAGIDPRTPGRRVSRERCARLAAELRATLEQAVRAGGSTLRDFCSSDGSQGHFQLEALVYGRAGQPCRVCARPLAHVAQGQRSTYFCASCQRR